MISSSSSLQGAARRRPAQCHGCYFVVMQGRETWGARGGRTEPGTHANYCDIIVLRGTQSHGEDPMSNRTLDQGPGHDATLGWWFVLLGRLRGGLVQDVVDVHVPHYPPAIFEDLGLELGSHVGVCDARWRGTTCAVLPTAKEGRRWSRYERTNGPVCHCQRIPRFELYSP